MRRLPAPKKKEAGNSRAFGVVVVDRIGLSTVFAGE
jgi:hypothetical protein